jgi:glycerol-3-phosphate acyltransferase PlsY
MGSQNPGAANVIRSVGTVYGLLVLGLDFAKTFVPMLLADHFVFQQENVFSYYGILITGLFAILGHCKPIYYHFKGGRGVSSVIAIYIYFVPVEFLISTLLAAFIVMRFIHVPYRMDRIVPGGFITLTPFIVLLTSIIIRPESVLYGIVGKHPGYVVVGTFISSFCILVLNLLSDESKFIERAREAFGLQN